MQKITIHPNHDLIVIDKDYLNQLKTANKIIDFLGLVNGFNYAEYSQVLNDLELAKLSYHNFIEWLEELEELDLNIFDKDINGCLQEYIKEQAFDELTTLNIFDIYLLNNDFDVLTVEPNSIATVYNNTNDLIDLLEQKKDILKTKKISDCLQWFFDSIDFFIR